MPAKKHIDAIVVGGGLAGLVAAAKLGALGKEVVLLEKTTGLGGRMRPWSWDGIEIDRGYYISHELLPEILEQVGALPLRRHPLKSHSVYDYSEPGSHENMHHRLERVHPLAAEIHEALRAIPDTDLPALENVALSDWLTTAVEADAEEALHALATDLLTRGGIVDAEAANSLSVGRYARLLRANGPSEGRVGTGRWLPVGIETDGIDTWSKRSAKMACVPTAIAARILAAGSAIRFSAEVTGVELSGQAYTVEYFQEGRSESLTCDQLYVDVPPYQAKEFLSDDIVATAFAGVGERAFSTFGMAGSYISLGLIEPEPGKHLAGEESENIVVRLIDSNGPQFLGTYMVGELLGIERTAIFADAPKGSSITISMRMLPLDWLHDDSRKADVEAVVSRHLDAIRQSVSELGGKWTLVAETMAKEKTAPLHLLQTGTAPRGDALVEDGLAFIGDGYDWTFHRTWGVDASLQSGRDAVDRINAVHA